MSTTTKIIKYAWWDIVRSKWLVAYTLFFGITATFLIRFGGSGERALLSLMNVVLILIPLVAIIFGSIYLYNSREYIELLLSQPIKRATLFNGLYLGLVLPLVMGFMLGVTVPFLWHSFTMPINFKTLCYLIVVGSLLTFIFVAIAFLIVNKFTDKVIGLGITMMLWILFVIIYDGFVLLIANTFSDYPLEKWMLGFIMLNPIDLSRVILLLEFDTAALMGYTGAVFEQFFGTIWGVVICFSILFLWFVIPYLVARNSFLTKDY